MAFAYGYDMEVETWKEIPGFPDYELSTFGRLRRCKHCASRASKLRVLPGRGRGGHGRKYLTIGLYRKVHHPLLHRIMLETFVGPSPSTRHQGAHGDGDTSNNRLDNLRWATPKENAADRIKHGKQVRGTSSPNTSLSDIQIDAIRAISARGVGIFLIAAAVGVGATSVGRIVRGETYK
ncbi:NUMOD4 motif-containing HNH endonuclease [Bradyrhizobium barranii subsp. apii]|uniref:NUMOD4 motif-containing HNH endonuclease n=1 Tax=Bradyrhizobium barranii TaxID=2992140 RepID=UPI001AA19E2A|nr:NUMOD4 motif-containing HNH endonuclease [Bradyrhizobium barranii]UPT99334.1 NUMOD4 motif-containing HNH endonuclease [Bradyrhizobium barranii subsp. apii]